MDYTRKFRSDLSEKSSIIMMVVGWGITNRRGLLKCLNLERYLNVNLNIFVCSPQVCDDDERLRGKVSKNKRKLFRLIIILLPE